MHALCIHLGRRYFHVGIFSCDGLILADSRNDYSRPPLDSGQNAAEFIEQILDVAAICLGDLSPPCRLGDIDRVAIVIPGPVTADTRVNNIPAIPAIQYCNLKEEMTSAFIRRGFNQTICVVAENDANAHATLFTYMNPSYLATDFIFVYLAYGLGGAFVTKGELRRGRSGQAGEIGHMVIQPSGRLCGCGGRGCLETIVSGSGIERSARKFGLVNEDSDIRYDWIIDSAAKSPSGEYAQLFGDFGIYLGIAIANLMNIWNPTMVLVGGEFGPVTNLFKGKMLDEIAKHAYADMGCPVEIFETKNAVIEAAYNLLRIR